MFVIFHQLTINDLKVKTTGKGIRFDGVFLAGDDEDEGSASRHLVGSLSLLRWWAADHLPVGLR